MKTPRSSHRTISWPYVVALLSGSLVGYGCVPRTGSPSGQQGAQANPSEVSSPQQGPANTATASQSQPPSLSPPPPLPAAPPPIAKTGNVNVDRFLELWTDIHTASNGYFSPEGVPYH